MGQEIPDGESGNPGIFVVQLKPVLKTKYYEYLPFIVINYVEM